tara:strand:+ start:59 stop:1915 length:1857 start_codon:yes stop_codon:yes gene_type:complete
MDALRSFLSGRRLAIMGIFLAIPFVFFGSSSFGTVFNNYGKVNGLNVSTLDVSIAINSVTSRLQQIYGDEFTVESLEEGIFNNLVRNEIVSQKALLYQVKQMNLVNSEDEAKRLIMSEPSFQTDGLFDQDIFEATIRQNGILPNEYIENIQNSSLVNDFLLAISDSSFQIEAELKNQIRLIEQERNIDFFKIDFNALKNNINPTLEDALEYYQSNQLLFMDDEKRSFNLLSISQDRFKELVDIPEDFIENEYKDYLERINALAERRISHIMIEASNYASKDDAYNALLSIQNKIGNDLTFEEAAEQFSEDLASADQQGDLGFSSGDSFPPEFVDALDSMSVGSLSEIIELEELGSFHIIKFTEENKETPKSKESMSKQFLSELLEAESYALMLDLRDEIEDLLLSGFSVEAIANELNLEFSVSNQTSYEDFVIYNNPVIRDFLYGIDFPSDFAEILELDDEVLVASVSEVVAPSVLSFDQVTDDVFERLRVEQANLDVVDLTNDLVAAINDDTFVLDNSSVLQDSFTSVKRGSSLFPVNVLDEIFSSSTDIVKNIRTFNSDIYVFKVTKITEPSDDFISSIITDYDNFSSTTSLVKLNLIIEKEINSRIRDNIKNLNI